MRMRLLGLLLVVLSAIPAAAQTVVVPPTTDYQLVWTWDGQNAVRQELRLKDTDPWTVVPLDARSYELPALTEGSYSAEVRACNADDVCSASTPLAFTVQAPLPVPTAPSALVVEPKPPTSASRCAPYPAFPDASCTGTLPGITRTPSGSITTTQAGQVIENLDINGSITVAHPDVLIRNVRITNPGGVAVDNINCQTCNFTLEDSELDGTGNTDGSSAVAFSNYILRRNNIHHFGEGPGAGNNTLMEDNFIHSFGNFIATGAHQDGIQIEFGSNNIVRHNTILADVDGMNACIQIGNQVGNSNNLVEENLMGGGSICLGVGGEGQVKNNRITTVFFPDGGYYGPKNGTAFHCGNRWQDGPNAGLLLSGETVCQ